MNALKGTKKHLNKLIKCIEECNYKIRYEKGNFKSGFCILESKNIVIINKFHDSRARIETLSQILSQITKA